MSEWSDAVAKMSNPTAVRIALAVVAISSEVSMTGDDRRKALATAMQTTEPEIERAWAELRRVGLLCVYPLILRGHCSGA